MLRRMYINAPTTVVQAGSSSGCAPMARSRQVDARRVTAAGGAMHDDSEYSLCIPVVLHSSSTRVPCYRSTM